MNRRKIVKRYTIPTSISAAVQVLDSLPGKKYIAIEEGPMSGWLYRNLYRKVERFVVADPRRNKLISSDGDHDDKIDSGKLAMLLAGDYLREIYHSDDERRVELKHWVSLYHDRIHDAVRNINKIRARCRMHGVTIPRKVVRQSEHRDIWLSKLKQPAMLHLSRASNRILKNAVLGAVLTAINQKQNSFREDYEKMVQNGIIPSNARHTVARKLLTMMWGMWKRSCQFDQDKAVLSEPAQKSVCV